MIDLIVLMVGALFNEFHSIISIDFIWVL